MQVSEPKKLTGTHKARAGSNHVVKGKDGVGKQMPILDKTRKLGLKGTCLCLTCGLEESSEAKLLAAHPDESILRRQDECHVYAWTERKEDGTLMALYSDQPMIES